MSIATTKSSSVHEREISPPDLTRRPRKRRRLSSGASDITVYSWNVNGIAAFLQPSVAAYFDKSTDGGKASSLREFLRRHGWPTLLFLQEVKINPDDAATIRAVERAVARQSTEPADAHDYKAHFCLPSDKHNARGFGRKVYGVCSIVRADFSEQYVDCIRPVTWDVEGRFLVLETKATERIPKLAIINVYAVNGTENPYKDPETGQVVGNRHDRKLMVHSLLQDEVRELEERGFGVIIAGDLNIARAPIDGHPNLRTFPHQHRINRADFEKKFFSKHEISSSKSDATGLGMLDTFRHLHPDKKAYTYYPRRTREFGESCDRVDMILISKSLGHRLEEAGMHETPAERGSSDHVPLYARLEFREQA